MSISPEVDEAHNLAANLEQARLTKRYSYNQVSRLLYNLLGEYAPTAETLRQYHNGSKDPERVDLVVMAALACVYEVKIADLSPRLTRRTELLRKLIVKSRCLTCP